MGKGKGRRISRIRVFANLRASKFGMLVAINSPHSEKKQNFTRNSQSGSFNVMHFGITVKPMTAAYRHIITLASSLNVKTLKDENALILACVVFTQTFRRWQYRAFIAGYADAL